METVLSAPKVHKTGQELTENLSFNDFFPYTLLQKFQVYLINM